MRTATRFRISMLADVCFCAAVLVIILSVIFFVSEQTPHCGLVAVGCAVVLFLASWILARAVRRHDYHRHNRSRRMPGRNIAR